MQEDRNVKKKGFLKGMRAELKKVIKPTGKQTIKSTFVTITFVLIISIALIILNLIFGELSKLWIDFLPSNNTIINSVASGEVSDNNITNPVASGEVSEDIIDEILSGEIVSGE